MSVDGLAEVKQADELKNWRRDLDPVIYDRMMFEFSLDLLRASSSLFEV